jgi:hypothetical protein
MAFDLFNSGNLSPRDRLKINELSVSSVIQSPLDFQGTGVNPPIILSYSVIIIVKVFFTPSHF